MNEGTVKYYRRLGLLTFHIITDHELEILKLCFGILFSLDLRKHEQNK